MVCVLQFCLLVGDGNKTVFSFIVIEVSYFIDRNVIKVAAQAVKIVFLV